MDFARLLRSVMEVPGVPDCSLTLILHAGHNYHVRDTRKWYGHCILCCMSLFFPDRAFGGQFVTWSCDSI